MPRTPGRMPGEGTDPVHVGQLQFAICEQGVRIDQHERAGSVAQYIAFVEVTMDERRPAFDPAQIVPGAREEPVHPMPTCFREATVPCRHFQLRAQLISIVGDPLLVPCRGLARDPRGPVALYWARSQGLHLVHAGAGGTQLASDTAQERVARWGESHS